MKILKAAVTKLNSFIGLIAILGLAILFFSSEKKINNDLAVAKNVYSLAHQTRAVKVPDSLSFAGEPMPLTDFEVYERIDKELLVNTYWQSSTLLLIKEFNQIFKRIQPVLKENGVPEDFVFLAVAESGLKNVISPSGAAGIWQFMESTGKSYGLEVNSEVDERYNLEKSTAAACKYLKDAYAQFGSWSLAAAAYNMGNGALANTLKTQKASSYYDLYLNNETSRYVFRIIALKEIMTHPQRYGFFMEKKDLYPPLQFKSVTTSNSIIDLAAFAIENGTIYKLLRFFNPWLRGNTLSNVYHKTYEIKIPLGKGIEEEFDAVIDTVE